MTNDIKISRELLETTVELLSEHPGYYHVTLGLLCSLLAAPVVERQECCTPTPEEKQLLANGDYTPEELWGGSRPTCPKCISSSPPAPVAVVPEGWKLVPIEPTDDMIVAFAEAWYSKRQTIDDPYMLDAYRDMLAVAPACELNQ